MAGLRGFVKAGEIALVGTTAKTALQIVAPANHRVLIEEVGIFFDGTSVSAEPVVVEVLRQTTAGTMSAATPVKRNSADDETLQTTAQHTATVEPSAGDILDVWEIHPQSGWEKIYPLGREIQVPGGTRLGIRLTAPANVNCLVKLGFQE
jgi:hypothetical protein